MLAMKRAVEGLRLPPHKVLVDGNRLPALRVARRRSWAATRRSRNLGGVDPREGRARPDLRRARGALSGIRLRDAQGLLDRRHISRPSTSMARAPGIGAHSPRCASAAARRAGLPVDDEA
jgi:hypothetical protein